MTRTNILVLLWLGATAVWLLFGFIGLDIAGRAERIDAGVPEVAPPPGVEDEDIITQSEILRDNAWTAIFLWLMPPIVLPIVFVIYANYRRRREIEEEIESAHVDK